MHCSNCGSYIPPGVRFCSNCGSAASDPEATRIARVQSGLPVQQELNEDLEQVIFTVRPTMIFIKFGYALAVLAAFALVLLLAWIDVPALISVPIGLALLLAPAYYHLRRNMVRYTLTDAKLEIDTGLIARTTRNIPLSKIQDVTVSASIPQRMLGFGDLIVDNASELSGTTILHNISNPRHFADLLLRQLRRWH
jgi:membrane protein YdbS with pleckstrin-like domain